MFASVLVLKFLTWRIVSVCIDFKCYFRGMHRTWINNPRCISGAQSSCPVTLKISSNILYGTGMIVFERLRNCPLLTFLDAHFFQSFFIIAHLHARTSLIHVSVTFFFSLCYSSRLSICPDHTLPVWRRFHSSLVLGVVCC